MALRFPPHKGAAVALLGTTLLGTTLLGGCGKNTPLAVRIVAPPGQADPFTQATQVQLRLMPSDQKIVSPVNGAMFEAKLELEDPPRDDSVYLIVEALDSSNALLGRGRSPEFTINSADPALSIYVGRPAQVTPSDLRLPDDANSSGSAVGRRDLAGVTLRGRKSSPPVPSLGALIAGGTDESGVVPARTWVYKTMVHQVIDAGQLRKDDPMSLTRPRSGAVLVASADSTSGMQAILWGGVDDKGTLPTYALKFDPQVSAIDLTWALPAADVLDAMPPGAVSPSVVELEGGNYLVSGGYNKATGGDALAQAVLLKRIAGMGTDPAKLGVTRIPPTGAGTGPLVVARAGHTATVAAAPDGKGALLFGGLSATDAAAGRPVAEFYNSTTNAFTEISFTPAPPSLRGHGAVALPDGQVLIVGGYSEAMGKKTLAGKALVLNPTGKTLRELPDFLKTRRYAASTTVAKDDILICGGFDENDQPIADCELFTLQGLMPRSPQTTPLPVARAGHLALVLENDLVLLVGGVGAGGKPVAGLDYYTLRQ